MERVLLPVLLITGKIIKMEFLLCVFGMVMIVEGLPHFTFPSKMKIYMRQLSEVSEGKLRIMGLVLMLCGLIFVYFGKA